MAIKKITDLQLRDNVTDDLSLPGDDGIQTYRVTGSQVKTYVLSAGVVAETQLATDSVSTAKIQAGAVTSPKANFTLPTVQRFTSGSGTYTTPSGVKWIRVRMVGGGAGGTGSSTSAANAGVGTGGGNTTFGTSLLTASGGSTGSAPGAGSVGGFGGATTVNSPAIAVVRITGGQGSDSGSFSGFTTSGIGGASFFGGQGRSVTPTVAGSAAAANSGSGGSGGGSNSSLNVASGSGGGAGGFVEAIIHNPSATYSYAVGAGGNGGSAGTNGYAGGAGGSGIIIVEENYQ